MNRAYKITYLPPCQIHRSRLAFQNPRGRTAILGRDLTMPAEQQAYKLAAATPGFIAFGQISGREWVYICAERAMKGDRNASQHETV